MTLSNYLELELLDHLFGKGAYTPPTIYVGLSTADPLDDGSGLAEPSGNGYARIQTPPNSWGTASGGKISNTNSIVFPVASGNWGTVTHVCIFNAGSGGDLLASGALGESVEITTGMLPRFTSGQLEINLD